MIFTSSRDLANNGVLRWMNGAYDHSNHYLSSSFFSLPAAKQAVTVEYFACVGLEGDALAAVLGYS